MTDQDTVSRSLLLVGYGNTSRRDDGVAAYILRGLLSRLGLDADAVGIRLTTKAGSALLHALCRFDTRPVAGEWRDPEDEEAICRGYERAQMWGGRIELAGDGLVVGKLLAVVGGDGMHKRLEWLEQAGDGVADEMGGFALDLGQQGVAALAFDQADEGLAMMGADDRVALPMAYAGASLDRGRTALN